MKEGPSESACRSRLQCVTNAGASLRCCTRDGSRPPEIGLQEQISNRPVRLHPKDVVVSDWGKGVLIGRQVRIEKMSASEPSDDAPLALKYCQNRGRGAAPGSVGTTPAYGPDGSRCIGGMSSIQALVWNVRTLFRMRREMTSRQGKPGKGGSESGNLSLESRGFDSLPVKANHQPEASLA